MRVLGQSEIRLPVLVLGGLFRSPGMRGAEIERALDVALDHGLCAVDTAPLYDFGASESLLGRWLVGRRERVVLLGKTGLRWEQAEGDVLFETSAGGMQRTVRKDSRPASVRRDVEESLRRLQTDRLDLVQVHQRDQRVPLIETLGELERLRDEGKLRAVGVSNFERKDLDEVDAAELSDPIASVQSPLSLIDRRTESLDLSWAREKSCGFLAYSPLARGLLVGRGSTSAAPVRDARAQDPMFHPANLGRINRAVEEQLRPMAERYAVSLSALALGWVIKQPGVTAALVGAQTEAQVKEAVAADTLRFEPQDWAALDALAPTLALDRSAGVSGMRRFKERLRRLAARFSNGRSRRVEGRRSGDL